MAKQKRKQDNLAIFYENSSRAKSLDTAYYEVYDKLTRYVLHEYADIVKCNILISYMLNDLLKAQEQGRDIQSVVSKNFKDYLRKVEKGIDYKAEHGKRRQLDYDKYIIAGLWSVMCASIVLFYIKELLTDTYFIHASVDVLVAIVAFYILINNINNQRTIIKRYALTMKPLAMQISGILAGIAVVLAFLRSPFDFSFLALVCTYLFGKKMFRREMDALM